MRGLILAATLLTALPANAGDVITGRASVIDADTIEITGQRIRLDGIDAPESWQTCRRANGEGYQCGRDAADALDQFLAESRPTICDVVDHDRYKRAVARCKRNDGASVNAWLVSQGWAVDWERYSHGRFAAEQVAAKSQGLGIWQGEFTLPCIARAERGKRKPSC